MQDTPAGTLQRKKSLPDVKCLDVTTQAQGSKAMTREEISVLSSARREAVRRQLEEIEAYKNNPFLYILNPRLKVRAIFKFFFFCTSGGRNASASGSGRCFQITCFFSVCARAIKKMSARPTISLNIGVCLIWQNYTLPFQFINFIRKVNDWHIKEKFFADQTQLMFHTWARRSAEEGNRCI